MINSFIDKINFDFRVTRKRKFVDYLQLFLWMAAFLVMNLFAGLPIAIFVFIAVSVLYLLCFHYKLIQDLHRRLSLLLLLILAYAMTYSLVNYLKLSAYYVPASSIAMLATLLFSEPILALFLVILTALIIGLISAGEFVLVVVFLIGGIVAVCTSWQARRRSQLVKAGFLVGLAQFFTLAFFFKFRIIDHYILNAGIILFFNGLISCGLTMLLLPIFEYLCRVVTNISLLELSDMNHPLIKRMILEAPGTYHHSLIVGNLAEAAAQAIGANALLARVGSYYHDIGKIEKSNYFSENQIEDKNAHQDLSASMSRLVIMNHVKDGLELAKQFHLKPAIMDFISQHHGKSLVYYFYRRALEEGQEAEHVDEEPFRYPGPKPQTKETAIVLLADSVEAATRSIDEPNASRIQEVVAKMINNKFIDGQLDECDLTLKDLETISRVFVHILSGIYHSRVGYPEDETVDKKSTKNNSHKSAANKKNTKDNS